jgi:hypothetical protein
MPPAPSRQTDGEAAYVPKADAWADAVPVAGAEMQAIGEYCQERAEYIDTAVADADAMLDDKLASAGYIGTSTDTLAIGSGAKSLTIEEDLSFRDGSWVQFVDAANAANYMYLRANYNPSTGVISGTVAADAFVGSGSKSSWIVQLTGPAGPARALATAAEVLAGANASKAVSPEALALSQEPIAATVTGGQTPDCSNSKIFDWLLSGSITLNPPSATLNGASGLIYMKQPSSGGPYTLTRNAAVKKAADLNLTLSVSANKVDVLAWAIRGGVMEIIGFQRDVS